MATIIISVGFIRFIHSVMLIKAPDQVSAVIFPTFAVIVSIVVPIVVIVAHFLVIHFPINTNKTPKIMFVIDCSLVQIVVISYYLFYHL